MADVSLEDRLKHLSGALKNAWEAAAFLEDHVGEDVTPFAEQLTETGHPISHTAVAKLLRSLGYSLQSTRKKMEGSQHSDRDDQFWYINKLARECLAAGEPVISVDTKKERTRRTVRSGWHGMASTGRTGRGVHLRFSRASRRQGHSLWSLRPGQQQRLGLRMHRP